MFEQETGKQNLWKKEKSVVSFRWTVDDFPSCLTALTEEGDPLTSGHFAVNDHRWRAILTEELDLFLQLVCAAFPVSVEIR